MAQQLEPAPTHIPMVDPKTGMVNYVWANWFNNNRERTIYRGALIQKTVPQTITTGFNETLVTFEEIGYDTQGISDITNNRLIVPADARRIQLAFNLGWDFGGSTNDPTLSMRCVFVEMFDKDGNSIFDNNAAGDDATNAAVTRLQKVPGFIPSQVNQQSGNFSQAMSNGATTGIMDVEPGDYFQLKCNHNRGLNVDVGIEGGQSSLIGHQRATWMSMVVLG
tara:strand:- start:726 stop:1391 length:666 start_codon:yes stop_codon:yes gene_type:complete